MEQSYSVKLKTLVEETDLKVIFASTDYETLLISTDTLNRPGMQLAGYYGYFVPDRIQLIGKIETTYLNGFPMEERLRRYEELLSRKIPALVFCHGMLPSPELIGLARKYDVTILGSEIDTFELLAILITHLKEYLAPRITRHGVFVEVYGEGLFLTGESGVGKSEAAIELIKRGHRLIADDAVEIKRIDSKTLVGSAPDLIRYYIELRGIGIVDVRRTFGSGAIKESEHIDLVINIESWKEGSSYDRLGTESMETTILGVKVPYITIPIKPGRNLAVILEVAAMNNRQKKMGYNSAQEFTDRINRHFDEKFKSMGGTF
ncbi:MAG: HPr(Ser) kinase/phosphatase [Oscillospiraceae bacterium]|nr:HPr(Ser) kinase/phosphatase [Oscillospiraceae bacterium]